MNIVVAIASLFVATGAAAHTTFLGKRDEVPGGEYYSRNILAKRKAIEFPHLDYPIIRNVRFCLKQSKDCADVFPSNDQIIVTTRFVSQTYEDSGLTSRVYLYQSYGGDTNKDGIIDEQDHSTIYGYEPTSRKLAVLEENVEYLHDLRDDVNSRSFFLLFEQNGKRYINRYSVVSLDKMDSRLR